MTIEFYPLFDGVEAPKYATTGSAGLDLIAHNFKSHYRVGNNPNDVDRTLSEEKQLILFPGDRALIGLGFSVAIPMGYEMQIRPRSGNALKRGITVLNSPGTIDSDYRGEVGVILINQGKDAVLIKIGEAIAQGVIAPVENAEWKFVNKLTETVRGEGGFGSTNK